LPRAAARSVLLGFLVLCFGCTRGTQSGRAGTITRVAGAPGAGQWQDSDPSFTALPGARARYGKLGQALYEIEVPSQWNGEVVMYAHGFVGSEPFLLVSPPPLRQHLIDKGFAWAASSFSQNGYDPQSGVDDTLALLDFFRQNVGEPSRAYIYGSSMGGHVVVSSLEEHPGVYAGALSECGVVAGVEEMDYLLGYEALGQYFAGLNLLPVHDIDAYEVSVRNSLIPLLGNPTTKRLTPQGRAFESAIENLSGGPRPFRQQGFLDRFSGDFTATFDDLGRKSLAASAATNVGARYHIAAGFGYTDDELNAGVFRLTADATVRNPTSHPALAALTGKIDVPLLTIHTTGDDFVPLSLEQDYRRIVDAAGNGDLLVQRAVRRPDHCQFSETEREQAWDAMVQWVEHGDKPDGDDLLSFDPQALGLRWTDPLLPGDPGGL